MDFYMYKSFCPRWYAIIKDIRHIVVPKGTPEAEVVDLARKGSNSLTGSGSCDIKLLQKYHMIIQPKKSYAALTAFNFHGTFGSVDTNQGIEEVDSSVQSEATKSYDDAARGL